MGLPPGQRAVPKLPVFTAVPPAGLPGPGAYRLWVRGRVKRPLVLSLAELLPRAEEVHDFHCVTGWSRERVRWEGVPLSEVLEEAGLLPGARWLLAFAYGAYSAAIPLDEALKPGVLLATRLEGRPIPEPYGGPVRLVVPHLYGWKSVKWLMGIKVLERYEPGYWEARGYHPRGDPWKEERYG